MRTLYTAHGVLEPLEVHHASEMFVVLSDPALYEFENEPPPGEPWLRDRYRRLATRRSEDGTEQWLNWVLRLHSGEAAGCVQATVLPDGTALIAYELNSRHWRRGIGSAAVQAMLHELRTHHAVETVFAVLKARNHRSLGLLQRLGFAPASAAETARLCDAPDERVMTRTLADG